MEKENWYFEYIYKVWKTAVRISENVPDGAAGIPDQLCSGRFGGKTGWLLIKLLYVAVVYRAGIKIGVLTPDHILLFIGVYILLTGVYMLYYPNFTSLTTMIRDGKLDMYLVKPVAAQFLSDNAATGSVAACAGCGCGNRHDRDRLASGRTSRDGCLDRRLSLFPDLRCAF